MAEELAKKSAPKTAHWRGEDMASLIYDGDDDAFRITADLLDEPFRIENNIGFLQKRLRAFLRHSRELLKRLREELLEAGFFDSPDAENAAKATKAYLHAHGHLRRYQQFLTVLEHQYIETLSDSIHLTPELIAEGQLYIRELKTYQRELEVALTRLDRIDRRDHPSLRPFHTMIEKILSNPSTAPQASQWSPLFDASLWQAQQQTPAAQTTAMQHNITMAHSAGFDSTLHQFTATNGLARNKMDALLERAQLRYAPLSLSESARSGPTFSPQQTLAIIQKGFARLGTRYDELVAYSLSHIVDEATIDDVLDYSRMSAHLIHEHLAHEQNEPMQREPNILVSETFASLAEQFVRDELRKILHASEYENNGEIILLQRELDVKQAIENSDALRELYEYIEREQDQADMHMVQDKLADMQNASIGMTPFGEPHIQSAQPLGELAAGTIKHAYDKGLEQSEDKESFIRTFANTLRDVLSSGNDITAEQAWQQLMAPLLAIQKEEEFWANFMAILEEMIDRIQERVSRLTEQIAQHARKADQAIAHPAHGKSADHWREHLKRQDEKTKAEDGPVKG